MATSLDDDLELNNQDYYSLLNVRKEVRFVLLRVNTILFKIIFFATVFVDVSGGSCFAVGASSNPVE